MDAEAKQAIKNRDMWKAFGEQFGWTLYGFSYDDSASFLRGPYDASIEITAGARDEINAAIYEAAKEATIQKAADELVHVEEYMYIDEGDQDTNTYVGGAAFFDISGTGTQTLREWQKNAPRCNEYPGNKKIDEGELNLDHIQDWYMN